MAEKNDNTPAQGLSKDLDILKDDGNTGRSGNTGRTGAGKSAGPSAQELSRVSEISKDNLE